MTAQGSPLTPLTPLTGLPDGVDVVVVGSGAAGLVAACRTADSGRRVVVLEMAPVLGGTSAGGGGVMWAPANPLMRRAGLPDTREQGRAHLRAVTTMEEAEVGWYLDSSADLVAFPRLHAASNVSATAFHDAYPGGGATLGSAMTRAYAVATTITKE